MTITSLASHQLSSCGFYVFREGDRCYFNRISLVFVRISSLTGYPVYGSEMNERAVFRELFNNCRWGVAAPTRENAAHVIG